MFKKLLAKLSPGLGIDLGTANSLVYLENQGIVINEPSVVAYNQKTNEILAIGREAQAMVGRTPPHIVAVQPLTNGVISDFELTEEMLRYFYRKFQKSKLGILPYRPRVAIGIPCGITEVEKKAVEDAALNAGAGEVYLVEQALAAAIGSHIPIFEPSGNILIDIGGGTTDIVIISLGGIVRYKNLKIAGQKFNEDIIKYVKDEYRLLIGEVSAERVKLEIGSAKVSGMEKLETIVRGRDLTTGLPKEITLNSEEIARALDKSLKVLVEAIRSTIEETPPELVADISTKNIWLSGGGSLLHNLDRLIESYCAMPVKSVDDPLTAVVRGLGIIVEDLNKYKNILTYESKDSE
ncbi:MAG: rod shape-determining protein [Candidatus Pacebacteria bacterium]|nr:rod shape-determining protein [Candidatus Paceibacterota bacterium]